MRNKIKFFIMMLVVVMGMSLLNDAYADKHNIPLLGQTLNHDVDLMLGKADVLKIPDNVGDILVANPDIVDVVALKSNRLYLVGTNLGDTNILALDADGNIIKRINVHVKMDVARLQSMIKELYPFEPIEIRALNDQVLLTGSVSTPSAAAKITELVSHYTAEISDASATDPDSLIVNMMKVQGEQQVMLRVKIVEASRNALKDLGLEANSPTGGNIGDLGFGLATSAALGLSNPTQLGIAALNYSSGTFGELNYIARALEEEGIVNTLAEPNLTAISGEQAGFLAGGEFPIPSQLDRNGNLTYEFRPFGVSLNFRPIVISKDRISLQLTTEVSTTSFEQNLQLNGVNVPTFNVRRAETTVELPSGGTLMIAGLLQSDSISGLTKLPGVGDIPVVGDLVKSDTFQRDESEVVVMITPYLVKPFADNQATMKVPSPRPLSTSDLSHVGPKLNYGALEPDDTGLPLLPQEKKPSKAVMGTILNRTLKDVYGSKLPDNDLDRQHTGYILP